MVGEDTLFWTRDGFRSLKDLEIGDEVLTQYGVFLPIFRLGEWKEAKYVVNVGYDKIYCRDSSMFAISPKKGVMKLESTNGLVDKSLTGVAICDIVFETGGKNNLELMRKSYVLGLNVPKKIPKWLMEAGFDVKCNFIAGMVDSVNGGLSKTNYYILTSRYENVIEGLKVIIRLLGWVYRIKDEYTLCVYPYGLIDSHFIRCKDPYNKRLGHSTVDYKYRINGVYKANGVRCREVLVGAQDMYVPFVVGKSMIPMM